MGDVKMCSVSCVSDLLNEEFLVDWFAQRAVLVLVRC